MTRTNLQCPPGLSPVAWGFLTGHLLYGPIGTVFALVAYGHAGPVARSLALIFAWLMTLAAAAAISILRRQP